MGCNVQLNPLFCKITNEPFSCNLSFEILQPEVQIHVIGIAAFMHGNSQFGVKLVQGLCGSCALLDLLQQALQRMRHPLLHYPVPTQVKSLDEEICSD